MQRNLGFDFFRYLFALIILLHHAFKPLRFLGENREFVKFETGYLAVDAFFILSGFFIALSVKNNPCSFSCILQKRLLRLYPEYFFISIISLIINYTSNYPDCVLNFLMISDINNVKPLLIGSWYVSVLFWVSIPFYILITNYKNITPLVITMVLLTSFLYAYTKYNNFAFNSKPLIDNIWSAGFLKGIIDISLGICLFNSCEFIKKNDLFKIFRYKKIFLFLLEIISIVLILNLLTGEKPSKNDFIFFIPCCLWISIIYFNKSFFLHDFWLNKYTCLFKTSYALYLSHMIILKILEYHIEITFYNWKLYLFYSIILSITFAFICYHAQKWLFAKLKNILFISNPQTPAPNIAGDK